MFAFILFWLTDDLNAIWDGLHPNRIYYHRELLLSWENLSPVNPPVDFFFPDLSAFADGINSKAHFNGSSQRPRK